MNCADCCYFDQFEREQAPGFERGICRARPPVPVVNPMAESFEDSKQTFWPEVDVSDWCGDYEPKAGTRATIACIGPKRPLQPN